MNRMEGTIAALGVTVFLCYVSFIAGCFCGRLDLDEMEKNGYRIVKHEIRHGNYHTNWVEVVRKQEDGK